MLPGEAGTGLGPVVRPLGLPTEISLQPLQFLLRAAQEFRGVNAGAVREDEAVSAHYLRGEYTGTMNRATLHGHLWSPSYFSASCGGAPPAIIRQYIEQQQRPL